MRPSDRLIAAWAIAAGGLLLARAAPAAVQTLAWYRLGDDDPGAAAGNIGDNPTLDHTSNHFDLARYGSPRYSGDVPNNTPTAFPDKLSMQFLNYTGPSMTPVYLPGFYSRTSPVVSPIANYGLECWVKSSPLGQGDPSGYGLIAYNGTPFSNGIGFFQHGKNYVVRVGSYEKILAPASTTTWTHLAFVRNNSINDFYAQGLEQPDVTAAAQTAPTYAGGAFYIGGRSIDSTATAPKFLFNGLVDEARFFSLPTATPTPTAEMLIAHIPRDLTWSGSGGNAWNTSQSNWLDGSSAATWSNLGPDNASFGAPAGAGPGAGAGAGGTSVSITGAMVVGKLSFLAGAPTYTLSGASTLAVNGLFGQGLSAAASANIEPPVQLGNDQEWNIAAAQTVSVNNTISGQGLTKTGPGTLVAGGLAINSLAVGEGTVRVSANRGTARLNNLSVAAGAALDLTNNDLVVNDGNFSDIRARVLEGFGNTTGIISSSGDGTQILALFDNALVGATQWAGQAIGPNAIVGKYTYFGDANFDGQVTGDDYTIVDSNLNSTPPVGLESLSGDMNLDGVVTGDDYTTIDSNLGLGVGNPLTASALAAVPEPGVVGLGIMALLLGRRRRREIAVYKRPT